MTPTTNLAAAIATPLIRLYQWCVSPFLGTSCRFEPSCSHYAKDALTLHGAFKGAMLILKRLCRCHPFGVSGFDPVPPREH